MNTMNFTKVNLNFHHPNLNYAPLLSKLGRFSCHMPSW